MRNNQSQNRDAAGNRMGSKHCELAAAVAKNCGAILSHWWRGCAAGKSSCHIGVFLMSGKRHGNSPRVAGSPLAVRGSFLFLEMRAVENMRLIFLCVRQAKIPLYCPYGDVRV